MRDMKVTINTGDPLCTVWEITIAKELEDGRYAAMQPTDLTFETLREGVYPAPSLVLPVEICIQLYCALGRAVRSQGFDDRELELCVARELKDRDVTINVLLDALRRMGDCCRTYDSILYNMIDRMFGG